MKKSLSFIFLAIGSLLFAGCDSVIPDDGDKTIPELVSSEEYLHFWNPSTTLSFDIKMSANAAFFLDDRQTYRDDSTYFDYYVPCNVTYSIDGVEETMEEVGIRVKGNWSRNTFLLQGQFDPSSLAHFKLSFGETFDGEEYDTIESLQEFKKTWPSKEDRADRKDRTLFDMEKIDIKWNRNLDETKSKQSYMLKTFRDKGVIAGHATLTDMTLSVIGGQPINATYEILEVVDSVLIKRYFNKEHADGDLYKCTYQNAPANFSSSYTVGNQIGIEDNKNRYHPAYDLKTNKTKSADHLNLLNLIAAINNKTSTAETYKTNIEKFLDMDSFLMYEAIAFIFGNFDDFRNNANNYYLYISSADNIGYIIPYDFDRGLGTGDMGIQNYMTSFSAESSKMQCGGSWQTCSLFWRTICQSTDSSSGHKSVARVEAYRATYQANIEDLLNKKTISETSFTTYVNSYSQEYRGNPEGTGYDNISFKDYLALKIAAIKNYDPTYNITVS